MSSYNLTMEMINSRRACIHLIPVPPNPGCSQKNPFFLLVAIRAGSAEDKEPWDKKRVIGGS
jgi:hypothetical protein